MTKHDRKHSGSHGHAEENGGESTTQKFHKDWRVWLVVCMMLAAMAMYVLTLDDSILPSIMRQ